MSSVIFLPKMNHPNVKSCRTPNKHKFRNILQSNCNLQKCQGHEAKERLRNYSRLKETSAQLNSILDSGLDFGLDPFAIKHVTGTTGET